MAEDGKTGNPDGTTTSTPDGEKKTSADAQPVDYKALYEKKLADAQEIADDRKKERERRQEAERKLKELDRTDAAKNGDVEALRKSYDEEKGKLTDELAKRDKKIHDLFTKDKVRQAAKGVLLDDAFEDFWTLNQGQFELGSDDEVKVKDKVLSPADFVKQIAEVKPWWAANPRKAGSGEAAPDTKSNKSAATLPVGFQNLPKEEQQKWFRENPNYKLG